MGQRSVSEGTAGQTRTNQYGSRPTRSRESPRSGQALLFSVLLGGRSCVIAVPGFLSLGRHCNTLPEPRLRQHSVRVPGFSAPGQALRWAGRSMPRSTAACPRIFRPWAVIAMSLTLARCAFDATVSQDFCPWAGIAIVSVERGGPTWECPRISAPGQALIILAESSAVAPFIYTLF